MRRHHQGSAPTEELTPATHEHALGAPGPLATSPAAPQLAPSLPLTEAVTRADRPVSARWGPSAVTVFLCAVIAIQLGAITGYGLSTAMRLPVWSPIDEAAHTSYVQYVAENHRLPVMGETYVSKQVFALTVRQQPYVAHNDIRHAGLAGSSYEAFQPPLYYVVAAPFYNLAGGDLLHRVYALRVLGLVLLVLSALLLGRLARAAAGLYWLVAWSLGLVVIMMPGVVLRSVTVSNAVLAILLAILFSTELLMAWRRHSAPRFLLAAILLGLCLLTQTLLVALVPAFVVLVALEAWRRRWWKGAATGLVMLSVPVALVAPWLAFNESHYHALTADSIAISQQQRAVNPHHQRYEAGTLPRQLAVYVLQPVMPEDWPRYLDERPLLEGEAEALVALLLGAVVLAGLARPRLLGSAEAAVLGLPLVATAALLCAVTIFAQWDIMVARYTYPTLPLWVILGGVAGCRVLRNRVPLAAVAAFGTVLMMITWAGAAQAFLG